jgi:hypothetical protein
VNLIVTGVDVILFIIFIGVPAIATIFCKRRDLDTPRMFKIPLGVKLTVAFAILFTIYFSREMAVVV